MRTFEQLLTIMSIGENEMQRTLSIIAEIKVIADMNTERPKSAMNYLKIIWNVSEKECGKGDVM